MAKLPYTPNSQIKNALRKMWLRSRERQRALKNSGYCCVKCGIKQSRAKGREVYIEVHHEDGIDWDGLIDLLRERLLQTPDKLMPLCTDCHEDVDEHRQTKKESG